MNLCKNSYMVDVSEGGPLFVKMKRALILAIHCDERYCYSLTFWQGFALAIALILPSPYSWAKEK